MLPSREVNVGRSQSVSRSRTSVIARLTALCGPCGPCGPWFGFRVRTSSDEKVESQGLPNSLWMNDGDLVCVCGGVQEGAYRFHNPILSPPNSLRRPRPLHHCRICAPLATLPPVWSTCLWISWASHHGFLSPLIATFSFWRLLSTL